MIFDVQDYCDEDKLVIEIFDDTIPVSPPKIPGGFIGGDKKPLGTIDIALTSVVTDDTSPLQFRWYDIVRVEPPSGLASRLRVRTEWWSAEKLKGDRFASSTSKTVWDREHDADMSEMSTGSVTNSSPLKTPTRPLSREFESSPDASPDQRLAPSPMNKRQSVPLVGGGVPASVAGLLIKRGSRRKKFNKFRYLVLEAGEPLRIWAKAADCNKKTEVCNSMGTHRGDPSDIRGAVLRDLCRRQLGAVYLHGSRRQQSAARPMDQLAQGASRARCRRACKHADVIDQVDRIFGKMKHSKFNSTGGAAAIQPGVWQSQSPGDRHRSRQKKTMENNGNG